MRRSCLRRPRQGTGGVARADECPQRLKRAPRASRTRTSPPVTQAWNDRYGGLPRSGRASSSEDASPRHDCGSRSTTSTAVVMRTPGAGDGRAVDCREAERVATHHTRDGNAFGCCLDDLHRVATTPRGVIGAGAKRRTVCGGCMVDKELGEQMSPGRTLLSRARR